MVRAPDRHGVVDDITLRLDDDEARADHHRNPHLGITVGRFANRIGGARFELDGVVHELVANEGDNLLHGGRRFRASALGGRRHRRRRHLLARESRRRHGLPWRPTATVHYRLVDTTLHVDISAMTDAPTVCSLSNHTYWNLGGPTETTIDDHVVTLDASTLVPVDADLIPDGEPVAAEGPFDLRTGGVLGGRIDFRFPPVMTTASWSTAPVSAPRPDRSPSDRAAGRGVVGSAGLPVLHGGISAWYRGRWPHPRGRCARPRTPACRRRTQPAVGTKPGRAPASPTGIISSSD